MILNKNPLCSSWLFWWSVGLCFAAQGKEEQGDGSKRPRSDLNVCLCSNAVHWINRPVCQGFASINFLQRRSVVTWMWYKAAFKLINWKTPTSHFMFPQSAAASCNWLYLLTLDQQDLRFTAGASCFVWQQTMKKRWVRAKQPLRTSTLLFQHGTNSLLFSSGVSHLQLITRQETPPHYDVISEPPKIS